MKNSSHTNTETGGGFVATIFKLKAYRQELIQQVQLGLLRATYIEARFNAYKRVLNVQGGQKI